MQTRADILALISSLIADNTTKDITAEDVRTVLEALTNSSANLVDDTNLFGTPPYLALTNPGGAIVAGDIGKFAMPHPSTAGAAAVYAHQGTEIMPFTLFTLNTLTGPTQASFNFRFATTFSNIPTDGDTFVAGTSPGTEVSVAFVSGTPTDLDTEVEVGATLEDTIQNLQANFNRTGSPLHYLEMTGYTVNSATDITTTIRARPGGVADGAAGNSYQIGFNARQFNLSGGLAGETLELINDDGSTGLSIEAGIDVAIGNTAEENAVNVANYINANAPSGYAAAVLDDGFVFVEFYQLAVGSGQVDLTVGGKTANFNYTAGLNTTALPVPVPLGKIIARSDSHVWIDTHASVLQVTETQGVAVLKGEEVFVDATGTGVVPWSYLRDVIGVPVGRKQVLTPLGLALEAAASNAELYIVRSQFADNAVNLL